MVDNTITIAPVIPLQTVGWLRRYGNGVSSTKCGSQLPVNRFLENQILKVINNPCYQGRKQWCLDRSLYMDVINWFGIRLISIYLPLHLIFRLRSIFHIDLILEPFLPLSTFLYYSKSLP